MRSEKELKIEYSDRNVTAWGGMKLMKNLVDSTGIKDHLRSLPIPLPGSNRGYDPIKVIENFWCGVWIDASRFAHCDMFRYVEKMERKAQHLQPAVAKSEFIELPLSTPTKKGRSLSDRPLKLNLKKLIASWFP